MLNLIFKILIFCTGCVVIAQESDTLIVKQIALQSHTTRTKTYHFLWGKHYKKATAEPISALDISTQSDEQNKVILFQGKQYELESIAEDFNYFQRYPDFNKLYQEEDCEDTFAQKMIADAYTMHYPFVSLIANEVAKNLQLSPYDLHYFYKYNKLYKGIPSNQNLITTDSLIT